MTPSGVRVASVVVSRWMSLRHMVQVGLVTCAAGVPIIVDSLRGKSSRARCDAIIDRWSLALCRGAKIQIEVAGGQHMQGDEAFVVVSNHQSHYDIPVLFQTYDKPLRMVAKRELFRVPVMGRAMRAAGFIEVDRGNHAQAIQSLGQAAQALRSGTSIWIAPEGTRSPDGQLGPFKKGGFRMAMDAGVRILPVTIDGTRETLLPKTLKVTEGARVRVTFSAPVDTRAFADAGVDALMQAVRAAIQQHLP